MKTNLYQKIGQQIKRAREELGISQEDLAKEMGYNSPATISHFESGQRKISIGDLQEISNFLGLPLNFFLDTSPNTTSMQHFQLRAKDVRPSARKYVAEFLSFTHNNGGTPNQLANLKNLTPEEASDELLKISDFPSPPVEPAKIADYLGIPVFDWDFPDEISGIFVIENNRMSIGVNQHHPNVRQRFTVAHELGHFIYQGNESLFLDFNESVIPTHFYDRTHQILETKANRFAANLLMPRAWVKNDFKNQMELSFMARRYKVSEQAMWFRLINLKLVENTY